MRKNAETWIWDASHAKEKPLGVSCVRHDRDAGVNESRWYSVGDETNDFAKRQTISKRHAKEEQIVMDEQRLLIAFVT